MDGPPREIQWQVLFECNLTLNKECVTPYAAGENARQNPRFSRTLGFTIQLDTVEATRFFLLLT